jgi:N-acetylglucosamine kinase-like BadF-type ATPase
MGTSDRVTAPWVLGVDSGGTGVRVALARTGRVCGQRRLAVPVGTGPAGIDAGALLDLVLPAARELTAEAGATAVEAAAVGAAGMASLGADLRAKLPGALAEAFGVRRVALAADAVTAYAGALGERPGAVVAAGTGLIAVGTDLRTWRRVDGWGHLLGDCGGGAWIGRAGMEAAMRAHDGRRGGSPALLAAVEAAFGPVTGLPGQLYPRPDRPAVMASFAPEVARCAAGGDAVAAGIVERAAVHAAESAAAAVPADRECAVACTGGLFAMGELLLAPFRAELARLRPLAEIVAPAGDPLQGSVHIAGALATNTLTLPTEPPLLTVTTPASP